MQFACKTAYRQGYFFVINYIDGFITVMRTIEKELSIRDTTSEENKAELSSLAKSIYADFQAQVFLIDYRDDESHPDVPNVRISENSNGAIAGFSLNGLTDDSIVRFYPGSTVQFSSGEEHFNFKVRNSN